MTVAQNLQERFLRQCRDAQRGGRDHFIDQDTKTLIAIDPITGLPGPFGVWVRALRLQRRQMEQRWTARAARLLRRLLNRPRKVKGTPRDRT